MSQCANAPGATCSAQSPFAKTTEWDTVSWFCQTGYWPAGIVSVVCEGPVAVSAMNLASSAEPAAGNARVAVTAARPASPMSRELRIVG